jgi:hypothetical protein
MRLEHRLQSLELKWITQKPGCNVTLFIVVPQDSQDGTFDPDTYRPASIEIEIFLKKLKDNGQCRNCKGSCCIDWAPDGFSNHTVSGECSSSSSKPKISLMFCADAEIPMLCRSIMIGEREPL